jgi:hypothetical protein
MLSERTIRKRLREIESAPQLHQPKADPRTNEILFHLQHDLMSAARLLRWVLGMDQINYFPVSTESASPGRLVKVEEVPNDLTPSQREKLAALNAKHVKEAKERDRRRQEAERAYYARRTRLR